jgi:hypothetical protein
MALTFEYVKKYVEDRNHILLSDTYIRSINKLKYRCPKGHEFMASFDSFSHGHGCPTCAGRPHITLADAKRYIEVESGSGYKLLSTEYKNNQTKLTIMCNKGHTYQTVYYSFQGGNRCPVCANEQKIIRQTHTYEYVKNFIENELPYGFKLIEQEYISNETPMEIECAEGHRFKSRFGSLLTSKGCPICWRENNHGENHPSWKPELTDEDRAKLRHIEGYKEWRDSVYERDNYTCQCCGDNHGGNLNAHHKDGYSWCKEKRTDVENGITLCDRCHALDDDSFHKMYGFGHNTEQQFNEWLEIKKRNLDNKQIEMSG